MNRVETTSTCGRCGAEDVREGAHEYFTPIGWELGLLTRIAEMFTRIENA